VVQKTKGLTHLLMNQALAKSVLNGTVSKRQPSILFQRQSYVEMTRGGIPTPFPAQGIPFKISFMLCRNGFCSI